jgi:multidrug transporter EmrE-like cation transporter
LQGLYKLTEDIARNEQWITIFIYAIVRDATITYAIWAGAGTALTAVLGILLFSENVSPIKILGVGCIVVGVGLLNLSQPAA